MKGLRLRVREIMWWCEWLGLTRETAWVHQSTDPARHVCDSSDYAWLYTNTAGADQSLLQSSWHGFPFTASTSCQSFPSIQQGKTPDRAGTLAFGLCGPKPIMAHHQGDHQETPCKSWLIISQTFMTCSACTRVCDLTLHTAIHA
jgi:hypothetical protein